jgi:hypothetical protein
MNRPKQYRNTWKKLKVFGDELDRLIRAGREAEAVAFFQQYKPNAFTKEEAQAAVRNQAMRLREEDSCATEPEAPPHKYTARQALIAAALYGWAGDPSGAWTSPVEWITLLDWAASYYDGPEEDLEAPLRDLTAEGLFFEVHPGVFAEPCYFCTYEKKFLNELPGGSQYAAEWARGRKYNDRHWPGWRSAGACFGLAGPHGPSSPGPCLGTSCGCFAHPEGGKCVEGLTFNPELLQLVARRRGETEQ